MKTKKWQMVMMKTLTSMMSKSYVDCVETQYVVLMLCQLL